jgi:hypothetical protein
MSCCGRKRQALSNARPAPGEPVRTAAGAGARTPGAPSPREAVGHSVARLALLAHLARNARHGRS